MFARLQQRTHSHAPTLSPSSSSPSSPLSPTSPHLSPSLSSPHSLAPSLGLPGLSIAMSAPDTHTRPHTIIPAPSIQKYSDELRRALSARFEAVAAAGRSARPPPPDARLEDPDYGYDEDPFDTRAKLLLSLSSTPRTNSHNNAPPLQTPDAAVPPVPTAHDEPESFFDLGSDTELDTYSRRWSVASAQSVSWFDGASTPSSEISILSEASFEAGRTSDWISLYGRSRLRLSSSTSRRNSVSSLSVPAPLLTPSSLRPLTPLLPSPQPLARRFRRRAPARPYDLDPKPSTPSSPLEAPSIARTTSETMMLAAGLSSQRERRRGVKA